MGNRLRHGVEYIWRQGWLSSSSPFAGPARRSLALEEQEGEMRGSLAHA